MYNLTQLGLQTFTQVKNINTSKHKLIKWKNHNVQSAIKRRDDAYENFLQNKTNENWKKYKVERN